MTCYPSLRMSAPCTFCDTGTFREKIEAILCSTLFTNAAKAQLEDIYLDMQTYVDDSRPLKIYPLPFSYLRINPFFAGHDLPVWLNNPEKADVRIMIISQDPRRSCIEMTDNNCEELGISSPWGIHSLPWRRHLAKGLLYHVARNLIDMFAEKGKTLSVYFTDAYKFRGVDCKKQNIHSHVDDSNKSIYQDILQKEIELVQPDIILTVGNTAQNMINSVSIGSSSPIQAPHPSAYESTWESILGKPCTACKKGEHYINEVIKKAQKLKIY